MTKDQLSRYFKRINCEFITNPTLESLKKIQKQHAFTFPFENLNPLLDIPVLLDIDTLFNKMVLDNRGGYCYEQNILFLEILKTLGYNARGITGRVFTKTGEIRRRTHMLNLIEIDSVKYLSDVGFGSSAPYIPLELKTDKIQSTPSGEYRIVSFKNGDGYVLQSLFNSNWRSLYFFDLQKQFHEDFEVGNHYTSTYRFANFKNNLMLSISEENCRHTLDNNVFTTYYADGANHKETINSAEKIRELLIGVFKMKLHNLPGLDLKLKELIER